MEATWILSNLVSGTYAETSRIIADHPEFIGYMGK
jgi:hypothetical protein